MDIPHLRTRSSWTFTVEQHVAHGRDAIDLTLWCAESSNDKNASTLTILHATSLLLWAAFSAKRKDAQIVPNVKRLRF